MGISNDWQVIDNLTYVTVNSARFMSENSCHSIADAIGWEVVHLADYTDSVDIRGTAYDTTNIYLIRPIADVDEEEYNCAISLFAYQSLSNWIAGDFVFELSTGTYLGLVYNTTYSPTSVMLLRPTSQGGFSFRVGSQYHFFDKAFNAKSGKEKWGVFNSLISNSGFVDLYTGLIITPNSLSLSVVTFETGGFVALKKLTLLSSEGIYNAKTIYRFMIDYNNYITKTIELNGIKYVNVDGRYIYIRLAE